MDDVKIVSLYLQRDESAIGETEKSTEHISGGYR